MESKGSFFKNNQPCSKLILEHTKIIASIQSTLFLITRVIINAYLDFSKGTTENMVKGYEVVKLGEEKKKTFFTRTDPCCFMLSFDSTVISI